MFLFHTVHSKLMDLSYITHILSSLKENQVNLPIVTNGFEETVASPYQEGMHKDPFESLDDMQSIIRNNKRHSMTTQSQPQLSNQQKKHENNSAPPPRNVQLQCEQQKVSQASQASTSATPISNINKGVKSLLAALVCVRDPTLTLCNPATRHSKVIELLDMVVRYIAGTPSKNLNITSQTVKKFTKGQLQEFVTGLKDGKVIIQDARSVIIELVARTLGHNVLILIKDIVHYVYNVHEHDTDNMTIVLTYDDSLNEYEFDAVKAMTRITANQTQGAAEENLKLMSVKDLRQKAQEISISTVDPSTNKLYTKTELRRLVENKLKTSV